MQVMQNISLGMVMCICLIGYNHAASLSMSLPDYRNSQNHLTQNVRHMNYIKRSNDIQTKEDQAVLELKNLKQSMDETKIVEKTQEKIDALENELATATESINAEQDETLLHTNEEKQTDTNIKSKDDHLETSNANFNVNTNGDRAQIAQPKQYHGAARLAFGQNPEIVSSTSTTTSTPASAQSPVSTAIATPSSEIPIDRSSSGVERESIPVEITNNGERRSGNMNGAKNAEYLFKFSDGKFSTLDMAQYVFWTGDEEGVAKAVEEFIRRGLMSRENAIKFLRDISMGIDYLENAYSANQQVDPIEDNSIQSYSQTVAAMTTTTTTTTTTEKPIILVGKSVISPLGENPSPFMQLNGISNGKDTKGDVVNFDETSGRLRLADFLYTEYSLEEVIYQLAKVMFTQSLSKGSEEAQIALQRLTTFLETEGSRSRISPALQKKVLDVLLVALSDCLVENPQLVAAARLSLGDSSIQLPKQSEKH